MVVSFCSIKSDATVGDGYGICEHLHSFRVVNYLQSYSKTLWMGMWNFKILPISGRA